MWWGASWLHTIAADQNSCPPPRLRMLALLPACVCVCVVVCECVRVCVCGRGDVFLDDDDYDCNVGIRVCVLLCAGALVFM